MGSRGACAKRVKDFIGTDRSTLLKVALSLSKGETGAGIE